MSRPDMILPSDDDREIWFANRMLVVVRARQPFVDWLNGMLEPDETPHDIDEVRASPNAFLIPLFEYHEEAEEWLRENYSLLFDTQLWDWMEDAATWPPARSWEMFTTWFDVELLGAPWDVVAAPLHSNPPPPEQGWN